jgi:methyl-accepting chemotaxis protein
MPTLAPTFEKGQRIMGLSQQDVDKKLAFFNITADDVARFAQITKVMNTVAVPALDRLYERIGATPETAGFFSSRQAMTHARDKQVEHWNAMFSGAPGSDYVARAQRIGDVHARIGLEPGWYIGAYASVLDEVIVRFLSGGIGLGRKRRAEAVASLVKMALLDMEVALSAYFQAEDAKRVAVIRDVGHAVQMMTEGDFTVPVGAAPAYAGLERDLETMRGKSAMPCAKWPVPRARWIWARRKSGEASDDLAHRTEQQAASLKEASAAITTLASAVRTTANDATNLHGAVQEAHGDAEQGGCP